MMKPVTEIPQTAMDVFNMLPEGTRCEVIDNAVYMSPSPTPYHQKIAGAIFAEIYASLKQHNVGEVFFAPLDVYLDDGSNAVQPDLLFIKTERLDIVKGNGIYGAPDLVIEILSGNRSHDTIRRLELYERNLITEYIIIDPEAKDVLHYLLIRDQYQQISTTKASLWLQGLSLIIAF